MVNKIFANNNGTMVEVQPLSNPQNYWIYNELIKNKSILINVNEITKDNWINHYESVLNLFKDGIETEQVRNGLVRLFFANN